MQRDLATHSTDHATKPALVESGLRSRDLAMPEEINRTVTDAISDYFFVTEKSGIDNLLAEGKPHSAIFFVGHVMIDNLFYQVDGLETALEATLESSSLKHRYPALRGGDLASPVQRRQSGYTQESHRWDDRDLPHPPQDPGQSGQVRNNLAGVHRHHQAPGLHCVPGPAQGRATGADGQRGYPGRNHRLGHSLPDAAGKHRATDYGRGRHQCRGRHGPGPDRGRGRESIEWAGQAGAPAGTVARACGGAYCAESCPLDAVK